MLSVFSEGEAIVHTSDGVRLFYRAIGEGRRTFLFMHGWAGTGAAFWTPLLHHLDLNARIVLVDLRGHGRSEHTRTGYTTERFAEDMFEVADHVGAQELITVGYSMSGRWAQWMSCTRPERIAAQILIGPVPAAPMPLPPELPDNWIQSISTADGYFEFERQFTKVALSDDILHECFNAAQSVSETALRQTLRMCTDPGFTERLTAASVPTLVIGGTHDPILPVDYLRSEVVDKIPGARLTLLDCGHNIPLEMPRETAAAIEQFVAALPSG